MYKILGGDGKEYGPISSDVLRQWISEGRANAQTQVQAEGATGWTALGQIPEFIPALGVPAGGGGIPSTISGGVENSAQAAQMVSGPAIGLIITAALGALAQVVSAIINIVTSGAGIMGAGQGGQEMPAWIHGLSGGIGVIFNVIGLIVSVVIFMGALKMKKLESYNFAMAATIVAMVPCISPCCLVGLPIGIWALVVLLKPEVKGAFKTDV